jgi:hypothetical protein
VSGAQAAAGLEQRQLQLDQQRDALNLNLQQSLRGRSLDLSPGDARRLDQLYLEQRLQQQQLAQQQRERSAILERNARLGRPGADGHALQQQRQLFAQERALQAQQFELERQRLLQSLPSQPLQPLPRPGQLDRP